MKNSSLPIFRYPLGSCKLEDLDIIRGKPRRLSHQGRSGVLLDDPFGGIRLGNHNLADDAGSISIWVMPLEDLNTWQQLDQHKLSLPDPEEFTLISDRETVKDSRASHFAMVWSAFWHPSFYVKRFPGYVYDGYKKPVHALATAGHFSFKKGVWYQLIYSWNVEKNRHRLFANGVLVGHSDQTETSPFQI